MEVTHRKMCLAFFCLSFFPTCKNLSELNQFSVEKGKKKKPKKMSDDLIMLYIAIIRRKCCVLEEYFIPSILDFQ